MLTSYKRATACALLSGMRAEDERDEWCWLLAGGGGRTSGWRWRGADFSHARIGYVNITSRDIIIKWSYPTHESR